MSWDALIHWSQSEFSHLPWRKHRTLYRTLVSEIMLQQTTVSTVLNHFERFCATFPDLPALARASEEELLVAWKGLGYYRRARSLKAIAEALHADHGGEFPHDLEALMQIKGIGPYTANALVGIGMDRPALAVDANLERVLARLLGLPTPKGLKLQKQLAQLFLEKKIFPKKALSPRALNEALMDLGRTICQARRAACELCPLKRECLAHKSGRPLSFPRETGEKKARAQEHEVTLARFVVRRGDEVLCYQKAAGEWLAGQWELPTLTLESSDASFAQYAALEQKLELADHPVVVTGITKYKIRNVVVSLGERELRRIFKRELAWRHASDAAANLSTASQKCLAALA